MQSETLQAFAALGLARVVERRPMRLRRDRGAWRPRWPPAVNRPLLDTQVQLVRQWRTLDSVDLRRRSAEAEMDRADLDVTRLAVAFAFTTGGRHAATTRRLAFGHAQELYRALEDGPVSEESLAQAIHGAWCSGTRSEQFHEWPSHRILASGLLEALGDPRLEDKLAQRATPDARDHGLPAPTEREDP